MTFGFDFDYGEESDIVVDYFLMGAASAVLLTMLHFAASRLEGGSDL